MTNPQHQIIEGFIRCLLDTTIDLPPLIQAIVNVLPELFERVQAMKDSGMTEEQIVQKLMREVKETP